MQDEVNEKVVSLAIKTSKLTAEVLQKAMKALLAKGKGQLTKAPHGKITMRQLMKPGEKVSNIEITDQNIKAFDPMTAHNGNTEQDERGLLPYPVIIAATKGDPEAMKIVVQHYESYIASLSMRKLIDERGNTYYGIDEDIRDRLRSKLMRAVLSFKV